MLLFSMEIGTAGPADDPKYHNHFSRTACHKASTPERILQVYMSLLQLQMKIELELL
jgi:hypothetical protein